MKKISVENIEDGMILARDVFGTSGSALLNKGTRLTPTMGRRLKNWEVPVIFVEGEEEQTAQTPAVDISYGEVQKELEAKFADVISNPIMKELFTAVVTFKTRTNNG